MIADESIFPVMGSQTGRAVVLFIGETPMDIEAPVTPTGKCFREALIKSPVAETPGPSGAKAATFLGS